MEPLDYRSIIREEIRKIVTKKEKLSEKERGYWEKVISNLLADLRDYETDGRERWDLEPRDEAIDKLGLSDPWEPWRDLMRRFWNDY